MGPQRPNIIDLINALIEAGQKVPSGPLGPMMERNDQNNLNYLSVNDR